MRSGGAETISGGWQVAGEKKFQVGDDPLRERVSGECERER